MTARNKCVVDTSYAAASDTAEYTVGTGLRATIHKFIACNNSATATTIAVRLVPPGQVSTAEYQVAYKALQPNETSTMPEIVGCVIHAGGSINVTAGAANAITINVSAREETV